MSPHAPLPAREPLPEHAAGQPLALYGRSAVPFDELG
jgi:hypothetical protein